MVVNKVRQVAEQQGYTIRSLSIKAELNYGTVRSLWLGHTTRIDFETLDRLCRTLEVNVGDLFTVVTTEAAG